MSSSVVRSDKEWLDVSENAEVPATRMFTSESYYRSFWDLAEHGVVLVDNNKQIIYANPYFVHMIGITSAELIGMHISEIIDTRYWNVDNVNMNTLIRGGQYSYSNEEHIVRHANKNNELIQVRVIVTRVPSTLTADFQHFIVQVYKIERAVQVNGQPFVNQNEQSYTNIFKNLLMQPWFIKTALWFLAILVVMLTLSGNLMPVIEKLLN
jgi:PAS domain S-box-containing protein